jgi:hypothetical protein
MPVLTPTGILFQIQDLENEVILRTENRTTDTARADIWIRDALLEVTSDFDFRNEFDQLEEYGKPFNLTPKIQEYDESNLIPSGDVNVATLDILIWQDPPTNSIRRKLIQSHYQKADNFQPTFSLPTEWYRFTGTIGFTPVPDKKYQIQTRMLRQHPINDNMLSATIILIPRDWNEVLIWMAVQRGFMELLEYDKAMNVHKLLHGDPKHPERIGLYESKKKRREQEAWRAETPLRPVYRRSCWGSR